MRNFLTAICILFIAVSCKNAGTDEEGEVLAVVEDDYLYAGELRDVIPKGTPPKDSLTLAKNYINNWVRQNLLVNQAERNLSDEQKNFNKQLEAYRNSLIVYRYQSLLIKQKIDTVVTEEEIRKYYEEHKESMILRENILRVNYVKLNDDTLDVGPFRELIRSDEPNDKARLDSLCEVHAADCFLNSNYWIRFNELIVKIPIQTLEQENYLRNHTIVELEAEPYIYLLRFIEYKLKGEQSPMAYEENNISRIILNKRKTAFIKNMEDELFNRALENNEVEIF
ncbi:MAG: hypothetical protein K9G67_00180 [Bacteroidales bacterium]|nr:hypothetical protein [Bacteroidales bacterium]MCF8350308.1 hypothetical protein [Bacteroidales bacterium]MCF8374747.1 hypothetical protein [Bacteroidales bacterium]